MTDVYIFEGDATTRIVKVKPSRKLRRRAVRLLIAQIGIPELGLSLEGDLDMLNCEVDQTFTLSLRPVDRKGRPSTVEAGSVRWELSDPSKCELVPRPDDQLKADGRSTALGQIVATAKGDPIEGEGVGEIVAILAISINRSNATAFEMDFTDPVDVEGEPPTT